MQETIELFCREAIGQRKIGAFKRTYTRKAKVLPPGAPIAEGIEAVKRSFGKRRLRDGVDGCGATDALTVEVCGESAVEIGHAEPDAEG